MVASSRALPASLAESLLRAMGEAVVVVDAATRIQVFNDAAEALFGYSASELLGEPLERLIPATSRAVHHTYVERFARSPERSTGMEKRSTIRGVRADGSTFPASAAISKLTHEDEPYFVAIIRDLTLSERDRATIQQQRCVLDGVASAQDGFIRGLDPQRVFDGLLSTMLQASGGAFGFLGEVLYNDDKQPYFSSHALTNLVWEGPSSAHRAHHTEHGVVFRNLNNLIGAVILSGEPVISNSPNDDPRAGGAPPGHPSLQAFLGLPILRGDEIIGVAGVANRPGGFDTRVVELLAPLTTAYAGLIEGYRHNEARRTALERAERSENYAWTLFQRTPVGLVLTELDGHIVQVNEACAAVVGRSVAEALTLTADALLMPPSATLLAVGVAQLGELAAFAPLDLHARHVDGSGVPVRVTGRLVAQDGRNLIWYTVQDRSVEVKRAEVETSLANAQRIARLGSWDWDIVRGRLWWSDEIYRMFGLEPQSFGATYEAFLRHVHPDDRALVQAAVDTCLKDGVPYDLDHRILLPTGEERHVRERGDVQRSDEGAPVRMLGTVQDVTQQRLVETQLRHAQRMDALGQLTGGIAHDFNNILAVMTGNLDLLSLSTLTREDHDLIDACLDSARRGASLINHLLAYSRQQAAHLEQLELNTLIAGVVRLARRTIGGTIAIELASDPTPMYANLDRALFESALLNLAINARDAMPGGGTLQLATRLIPASQVRSLDAAPVPPGLYAEIAVTDTGCGMTRDVLERVFDPFFTTKSLGHGTGLGLAMVYGFVRQSSGHVFAESEPGVGSTFRLAFPSVHPRQVAAPTRAREVGVQGGGRVVLVVEDTEGVRKLTVECLERFGFRVLAAATFGEALALAKQPLDLLLTDVILGESRTGLDLANTLREARPALPVLFFSGYAESATISALKDRREHFLGKPFLVRELAEAVRQALGDPPLTASDAP